MNNADVDIKLTQCRDELIHVESCIRTLGAVSSISPYLTKYAVIKACGTIEVSFKSIIADFCNRRSKKQIKHFIDKRIVRGSANPSYGNILSFLEQFDVDWRKDFQKKMKDDPDQTHLINSLTSLVDARNDFSHGGSPTVSIGDVITYFDYSRKVIEYVDEIVS